MSDELRDLYQEVIIDHSRRPRNFRELGNTAHRAQGYNPLCGDQVTVYLELENDVAERQHLRERGSRLEGLAQHEDPGVVGAELQLVLGDALHIPHDPPVRSAKITITVVAE